MEYNVFVINPGSSSTKIAHFRGSKRVFKAEVKHLAADIAKYPKVIDQIDFRYEMICKLAEEQGCDLSQMDAFASRGGFLRPIVGGTYGVSQKLLDDLKVSAYGEHASNVGPFIVKRLEERYGKPAYVTNPVSVDEFMDEARITGLKEIRRSSTFHALNHKAVAMRAADKLGKKYEELNLIVAHLGGGISIGIHDHGRVIDACNPSKEGPMSIDRAGTLPNLELLELAQSGQYTPEELKTKLEVKSGLLDYTGESNLILIEERAEKDPELACVMRAMAYRIAFWICGYASAVCGDVDAVVLTGGIARSDFFVPEIERRVKFLAPVLVFPGEFEMEALSEGAIRVLDGQEKAKAY